MPTKEENVTIWGETWRWEKDGDEFHQFATSVGQDYGEWKDALIEQFIGPHLGKGEQVLEIGCGHGRWSSLFVNNVDRLYLCDIAEPCLDYCRERFGHNAEYFWSDGHLNPIGDSSIDLVWCFDVMVHVEPDCICQYVMEIGRILKPGGAAILHHANSNSLGGWRSNITADAMRKFAKMANLECLNQTDSWGKGEQFSVKLHGDVITTLTKI
jgi:ubiquinone/menaquinone biosynthesis C-methylase UbiE